jgi:uncharacterized membrane protein
MEQAVRGDEMKTLLFWILKLSLFVHISLFAAQDQNVSIKQYHGIDEQLAYNAIKKIFRHNDSDTIIDTNWSSLHVSKRTTTGYIDMQVHTDNIVLTTTYLNDTNEKEIKLEIFSTINDEKLPLSPNDFLYHLFWNRIDYALGINTEWIDCFHSIEGVFYYRYPLCMINKEEIQP